MADAGREAPGPASGITRRSLVIGAGIGAGIGAAGAVGVGGAALVASTAGRPGNADAAPVPAAGVHQAGVDRPATPQQHCLVAVLDLDLDRLGASLAALGEHLLAITAQPDGLADLTPDGPRDLSVTVGLGPRALERTAHPQLASVLALPDFAGDAALPPERRGGDLLLGINASDPIVLEPVLASLIERLPGARIRWSDLGYRGASADGVARNPLGYHDGIIGPASPEELREQVWIADGPLAGGTICVIRRFRLDVDRFRELAPDARDAVIGRVQSTGAPLSGGERGDQVDLGAKSADGTLLVPQRAHARAAHPSFTGSPLMLRRSYSYRASDADHGHLFVSFQNDVQTFVRTQLRLDEVDALMEFSTPTATAAFAVIPGLDSGRPLGSTLF